MSGRRRARRASLVVRDARRGDDDALRRLVASLVAGNAYAEVASAHLSLALERTSDEARALVAEVDARVIGIALYGFTAGALGAGRLLLVATSPDDRRLGVARALVRAALTRLATEGARFVCVEMPDETALAAGRALLLAEGFAEEGRVRDLYRDGVDQALLVRRLSATEGAT